MIYTTFGYLSSYSIDHILCIGIIMYLTHTSMHFGKLSFTYIQDYTNIRDNLPRSHSNIFDDVFDDIFINQLEYNFNIVQDNHHEINESSIRHHFDQNDENSMNYENQEGTFDSEDIDESHRDYIEALERTQDRSLNGYQFEFENGLNFDNDDEIVENFFTII